MRIKKEDLIKKIENLDCEYITFGFWDKYNDFNVLDFNNITCDKCDSKNGYIEFTENKAYRDSISIMAQDELEELVKEFKDKLRDLVDEYL